MSIMDDLSKFAKSVSSNASNMVKKSGEMIELTRLNIAIQAEEDKIKLAQNEIGANIFAKFNKGETVDSDIIEYCNSIIQVQNEIEEIQLKITKLKNMHICEKCGQEVGLNTGFCPKCGEKRAAEESVPKPDIEYQKTEENV